MSARTTIPVTGSGGGGGGGKGGSGGGGSRSPQESPDSLRSIQYARVVNLVCEGPIEGIVGEAKGIFVDGTPLQNADGSWNFVGAFVEWRNGAASQSPIPGFSATEAETSVSVTVTVAAPVVRSVTNPNLNAVRVTLGVPGLSWTDTGTGDVTGTSVDLAIDVQKDQGGYQQIVVDTIQGKTTSRYQRSYLINLARFGPVGTQYDIRVRRLTPDSTTVYLVNAFQWETMTEVIDSNLTYPYSAVVGVQVDASTFKAIPKLAFDVRMRQVLVPVNYDPWTRTYSGIWDGTFKVSWTDNPAWIFYDLATTERFGLGGYVTHAMIDRWTLYNIGQYCDEPVPNGFGGQEPRYTCSIYIQERSDAIVLLQQIAAIFNGMLFWSGGMLTVAADMPSDPVMVYNPASIIDGRFTYVGTALNQRHTIALVTWNNPANGYAQEIEYVEDRDAINRWGSRELQVFATGATSRGQAHRVGRWMLLTEQMLSETVSFKAGLNASFTRPGDIFETTDPVRAGYRMGGRILSATNQFCRLDQVFPFAMGMSYTIAILLPDGTMQRVGVIHQNRPDDFLVFATGLRMAPERMAIWSISASNAQNEKWRCLSVSEDEEGNVEVTGVAYRPDKFAAIEQGLKLEDIPTGIIDPFRIAPCTELNITESLYLVNPILVAARATFSWLPPLGAVRYELSFNHEEDPPTYRESFMPSTDIGPTKPGLWHFHVWAFNALGIRSNIASLTREILALNRPPQDVRDFAINVFGDAAALTWRPADDLDVLVGGQMIVRYSSRLTTEVTWEEAQEIMRFAGGQSNGMTPLMKGTYLAKFMSAAGKFSINPTYVISTTGPLRDFEVVARLPQHPGFAGVKVNTEVRGGVLYISQDEDGNSVATDAGYYFAPSPTIDMGKVYTVRCQSTMEGAVYSHKDDVDGWPDWDVRLDVDGDKVDEGGGEVWVQMTNVNPAIAEDEDWSPFKRLVVADLTFRAARFGISMHVPDITWGMGITDLSVQVNVPDRIESRNNVLVEQSGPGAVIRFLVPFKDTPAISIVAQSLATGDQWLIYDHSPQGFTILFANSTGLRIERICDWIARGYGYEHEDLNGIGYAKLMGISNAELDAQRALLPVRRT